MLLIHLWGKTIKSDWLAGFEIIQGDNSINKEHVTGITGNPETIIDMSKPNRR